MSAELEQALAEKCAADPQLELLQAQWVYDKRLVSQALQTVGNTFPHYSLHDASHSNTILIQITRVLGDRLNDLSATDIWLLLESAYWHDMGMVVDDATIRKWWATSEFETHLDLLIEQDDQMLADAARLVRTQASLTGNWALNVRKAVTLVIADFARSRHAERSGRLVAHPLDIGVESPRTLIPDRLFRWLSEIAISHGRGQDYVRKLPYTECGVGTDVCHPRFIACMLRLGDLLDLDNGRFCPVLARSIGDLPSSSLDHVGKHASIRRFFVSPAKIEVEAVCRVGRPRRGEDPYGAYEAVGTWLDWLEQEIKFLASHWTDIAPENFGGAPSLGRIEARMEGYICLEKGERPKFTVDESAFLHLVRSNNLYEDSRAWLRELVANADDATRIRVFAEIANRLPQPQTDAGSDDPFRTFRPHLDTCPIHVEFKQTPDHDAAAGAKYSNRWRVRIRDNGTGISKNDLRYILTIGSSQKNPQRRRIIREMPDHFRPTGSFGIGLQSLFMVTQEVSIRTSHYKTRDRLEVVIRRPERRTDRAEDSNGKRRPHERPVGVYVRELDDKTLPIEPGTHLQFYINVETPGDEGRVHDEPQAIDPILEEHGAREIEKLKMLLNSMSTHMITPLFLEDSRQTPDGLGGFSEPKEEIWLYSESEHCIVKFKTPNLEENPIGLLYRGAEVKKHGLGTTNLINVVLDLQFGNASNILSASRDTLIPSMRARIRKKLDRAIAEVYPRYLARLTEEEVRAEEKRSKEMQ